MSSYSDAYRISESPSQRNILETHDFLRNRTQRWRICLILILLFIYFIILILTWIMIDEVSSKNEYLRQQWRLEQETIANQKKKLSEFVNELKPYAVEDEEPWGKCFRSLSWPYVEELSNIYEINQYVKEEFNQIIHPLQYLSCLLCLFNNFVILSIFKKSQRFYILSNILLIFCLCVYGDIFSKQPNVFYTVYIAWSIMIFTIYLLVKVISTLYIIEHDHSP